jgi:hypothetical protein
MKLTDKKRKYYQLSLNGFRTVVKCSRNLEIDVAEQTLDRAGQPLVGAERQVDEVEKAA